jgi:hypothetical protein
LDADAAAAGGFDQDVVPGGSRAEMKSRTRYDGTPLTARSGIPLLLPTSRTG